MPCYSPLIAWRAKHINPSGKTSLVFNQRDAAQPDDPVQLPCGQCIGCRLEKSRQWAMRIAHESSLYDQNCFLTLTFSDEHLPQNLSVSKRDLQLFMKRLRKHFAPRKIRFFQCGEYGELNMRPHYHSILFNVDFPDKYLWRE